MTLSVDLDLEQKFNVYPSEIREVLKMCYCVLPVVFIDTLSENDDASSLVSNKSSISHTPIDIIPVAAVNMLWCELLNVDGDFSDDSDYVCDKRTKTSREYWRSFISTEERIAFLRKCKMNAHKKYNSNVFFKENKRRNSLNMLKQNASTSINNIFHKRNSNPYAEHITTIQNPVFGFIMESLRSEGLLQTHIFDDSDNCKAVNAIFNSEKDAWFEKNRDFVTWFEKNTSISQNHILQAKNRLEYFSVNYEGINGISNLKEYLPKKAGGIEKIFELCNEALADACLRRLQLTKCLISSTKFSDDNKLWIQRDVSSVYAIRMLPLHHLRSGNLLRCTSLLTSSSFLNVRVEVIGVKDATRQHRLDCIELNLRMKKKAEIDAKHFIVKSIQTIKYALDTRRNDSNQGLIGKALHGLASLLDNLELLDEAMRFYQHAVDYKKSAPEFNQESIVRTLQRMGDICAIRGHFLDSLTFYEEALHYSKSRISPGSIKILQRVAKISGFIGNYEEAIFSYEQIINLQNHLKKNYMQVCDSYHSLGNVYEIAKRYEDAAFCYAKVLMIMDNNLDEEHTLVGTMHYNLGRIFTVIQDYENAFNNYAKALNWRRKYCGDNHIDVAQVLHALGELHFTMGDIDNAIAQFSLSLAIKEKVFGDNALKTVHVKFDLAFAYDEKHKFDKAIEIFGNIIKILKVHLEKNHVQIAYTYYNMGISYAGKCDYATSIKYFKEALDIQKKKKMTGGDSIDKEDKLPIVYTKKTSSDASGMNKNSKRCLDISDILKHLGLSYTASGDIPKGIDYCEQAIQLLRIECPGSVELADMYQTIGDALVKYDVLDLSPTYYMNAYKIRKTLSSDVDIYEGDYFNCMGVLCLKKEEHDLAMFYFEKALNIRKQSFGETHEKVADILVNIGQSYKQFLLYEEAMCCCNKAISIYEAELGLKNEKVANLLYNIAIIEANMGRYRYAITIFEKVIMIHRDLKCNDDHPCFSNAIEWIVYLREKVFLDKIDDKPKKFGSMCSM